MAFDPDDTTSFTREIGQQLRTLAAQTLTNAEGEVNRLIGHADKDEQLIEHLLDHLLDFCYDETVLRLFKRLCRYYFTLNPAATAQYIHFYREMWDTKNVTCAQE